MKNKILELNFRLDELKEIENSEQELTIRYRPFGIGKLRLLVNMERSLLGFTDMGFQEKDIDDVKGLLVDTEMYILLMTFIVSGILRGRPSDRPKVTVFFSFPYFV